MLELRGSDGEGLVTSDAGVNVGESLPVARAVEDSVFSAAE
jgi:hypothetical protein